MSTGWKQSLVLAAAMTMGTLGDAHAQGSESWPYLENRAAQVIPLDEYPQISPELLDPHMVDNHERQRQMIDDAALGYPYGFATPDLVLTTDAAYALVRGRAEGALPGAKDGQSPADWWRETEPKIFELMDEYRAERALPFQLAGALAGGFALMVGGSAALSAYRRRKNSQGPANDQRIDATMGGPTP